MSLKTYGDRPISFQLEENGEFYCIGSEVMKEEFGFSFTPYNYKKIVFVHRLETIFGFFEGLCTRSTRVCSGDL